MNKISTAQPISILQEVMNAFTDHKLIKVKKSDGQLLGPGYIAIMYGEVAFRMYSKSNGNGSHFIRMEEITEIQTEQQ